MRQFNTLTLIGGIYLSGMFACNAVYAQAQVVDAGSSRAQPSQQQPVNQAAGQGGQNEVIMNMYLQLENLQNEIQNLRGLVDEQSYQIRRMQTEQRDRYLDTDSRISELYNQVQSSGQTPAQSITGTAGPNDVVTQPSPGARVGQAAPSPVQPSARNQGSTQATAGPSGATGASGASGGLIAQANPQNEQELYRQALGLLLEEEEYEDSITLFQQYIDVYPTGRYFTNSLYWQGAALDLVGRYNQSITVLQRLIQEYPDDPKAPTAMLRLGTVYREMGNLTLAAENWRRISEVYPGSTSEIGLANEYLLEISN